MSDNELGAYLKGQRLARKLALRSAAASIGVDHMRLRDIERGVNRATGNPTRPSRELVLRFARAYEVPADTLLDLAGYSRTRPGMDDDAGLLLDLYLELDVHHRGLALAMVRSIHARTRAVGMIASEGAAATWPARSEDKG